MSRMLAIIAATSLLLCAGFLGLVVLIGGDAAFHDPRSLQGIKPLIDLATHKEWRWDGGDTLSLDAPANLRYEQKGAPNISVTGPEKLMGHVRVGGGRIGSDTGVKRNGGEKLQAVVTGVSIRKFVIHGNENTDLGTIDQPELELQITGNGSVSGKGKVSRLILAVTGNGRVDLGGLIAKTADVALTGNGEVRIAPTDELKATIVGSGSIYLLTKPPKIEQSGIGSGRIIEGN